MYAVSLPVYLTTSAYASLAPIEFLLLLETFIVKNMKTEDDSNCRSFNDFYYLNKIINDILYISMQTIA